MHIINIIENSKIIFIKLLLVVTVTFIFMLPSYILVYPQESDLGSAEDYIKQSESYYQQAVAIYKDLIEKGENLNKLHFELGKIYFNRGRFQEAIEELKKSDELLAKKFLAISLYLSNNFTDALEIFEKNEIKDDEYLYFFGLACEKLNLYDKAIKIYERIKQEEFLSLALGRIDLIERKTGNLQIKDIDQQIYALIKSSPSQKDYPQAGGLILFCDEKFKLEENSQTADFHYLIKILNERGKEEFAETQIEYDSTFEKVELEFARTIKPDGTVIDVGSRHIRDVSKYLNFPLYSNVRIFIISFPEIAEGSVIEYRIKTYGNRLLNKKDFILSYPVQSSEPILKASFSIDTLKTKKLRLKNLNTSYNDFKADLRPEIKEMDNRVVYSWQFKNIPQIIPESNMPPAVEINPTILISTFSSWKEIYEWWWNLAKDKISSNPDITNRVKELTKNKDSIEEKTRSIYNFCAKEIRYVAVEYGHAGHEPHMAGDIFKNKYGDCKDQSVLLVTMLKEAGVKAYPVLIPTKSYYNLDKDFPSVHFNHVITVVDIDEKKVFLDPTAETCSFGDLPGGDQNRGVVIFKEDGYQIANTPLFEAAHNLTRRNLYIRFKADESIDASREVFTHGTFDQAQRFWLIYTPPQLIEEALKEAIQAISIGATLESYEIENLNDLNKEVLLNYKFKGPEYLTQAGLLRIMPQLSGVDVVVVAKEKRKYPIDYDLLFSAESLISYQLPENFKIKFMPETVIEDSPWVKFQAEYSHKEDKLMFKQRTELKKTLIEQAEYPEYKLFLENLAKKVKQRVILERVE